MNIKEVKAIEDFVQVVLAGVRSQLPLVRSIEFALSSVDNCIKDRVRRVKFLVENSGTPFIEACIRAGFPSQFFSLAKTFEDEGNLEKGLEAVLRSLEVESKIDDMMSQIDREIYQLLFAVGVALFVAFFFYIPTVVSNILANLPGVSEDPILGFALKLKDVKPGDGIPFAVAYVLLLLADYKFLFHRKLLVLLPSYKKLQSINDKIVILSALENSMEYVETVLRLGKVFGSKYRMDKIAKFFPEMSFRAFNFCTLFSPNEREQLIAAGEGALSSVFSFMRKRYEKEREKTFSAVKSQVEWIKLAFIACVLLLIGMIPVFVMKKMLEYV